MLKGGTGVAVLRETLQRTMQQHAAVFRNSHEPDRGRQQDGCAISGVVLADMAVSDRSMIWNSDLVEALELQNLVRNGAATMVSAEARQGKPRRAGA